MLLLLDRTASGSVQFQKLLRLKLESHAGTSEAVAAAERTFPTTTLGRAIYESGLPHRVAKSLHQHLQSANAASCCATFPLHLLTIVLICAGSPVEIVNWPVWSRLLVQHMPQDVTDVLGAHTELPPLCCGTATV